MSEREMLIVEYEETRLRAAGTLLEHFPGRVRSKYGQAVGLSASLVQSPRARSVTRKRYVVHSVECDKREPYYSMFV